MNNDVILVINTVEQGKLLVALFEKNKLILKKEKEVGRYQGEKLLPLIDSILKTKKIKLADLRGIAVVVGPGGFSSVRVGCLMANVLSYSLKIPAVGLKLTEFKSLSELADKAYKLIRSKRGRSLVQPFYGQEPNITVKKTPAFAKATARRGKIKKQ